mgnify:CR=1 FL=1
MTIAEDFDRGRNDAVLAVLRVGAKARAPQNVAANVLLNTTQARFDGARLPRIKVPRLSFWQRAKLRRLKLPATAEQLSDMAAVATDISPYDWRSTGVLVGVAELDEYLSDHPNLRLRRGLQQIAQSSFAPDRFADFESYFKAHTRKGTPDRRRLLQAYVPFLYVTGSKDTAQKISDIVQMPKDLQAMRMRYQSDKTLYEAQRQRVDAFIADLKAHRHGSGNIPFPDWKEYIDTKG